MRRIAVALAGASLLMGSCAHVRPAPLSPACDYRVLPLLVSEDHPSLVGGAPAPTFADELADSLAAAPGGPGAAGPDLRRKELIVLSGGSQHGAFGGGFFIGRGLSHQVPTYDVVTGVSTGALQSTLVFLANDPLPPDREYPRDQGERKFTPGRSNLEDLGVALSISGEPTLLKVSRPTAYAAVVKGSTGSLKPLNDRLLGFVSEGTLRLIKQAGSRGRKLFVGVTDLDDGRGYAIDLTELASRLGEPGKSPNDAASLRRCYVTALVASSSVPVAAQPVTLDIKPDGMERKRDLFIDGGARFGVFLRQLGDEIRARQAREDADARRAARAPRSVQQPTNVTVIVNGKLYGKPWREKGVRPEKFSLLTMGLRSVDLLTNQVYRFSVEDAEQFPRGGGDLHMAFISNENLRTLTEPPGEHVYVYGSGGVSKTCDQWSDVDDANGKPLEFHARYMACLLDYGRKRAEADPWNRTVPPP